MLKRLLWLLPILLFCAVPSRATTGVPDQAACTNRVNATSVTCTWGGNIAAGDAVVLFIDDETGTTRTISSVTATGCTGVAFASTAHSPSASATTQSWISISPNIGGTCSAVTVTLSGSGLIGIVGVTLPGMATSSVVDCDVAQNGNANSGTATTGSCNSTNANDTILMGIGVKADSSPFTAGAGFTLTGTSSTGGSFIESGEYKNVAATGSQSATITFTAQNVVYTTMLVAIKQAGGATVVRHRASVINK